MIISRLSANVHTLQLAHFQCTYPAACSLPMYIPCKSVTAGANVHTLQLAHSQSTSRVACSLPVYIASSSFTASVHTLQLDHCQCTYTLQFAPAVRLLRMYRPCSSLTASVHTLQLAQSLRQCTYLAARSLPVYIPCT